jgi:NAD(P)H-dependent FMN reductase
MTDEKTKAKSSSERQAAHLARLAANKGAPVRVDTQGADLLLLDELVSWQYAPSRSEAYRKAMREAHAKQTKLRKKLDIV